MSTPAPNPRQRVRLKFPIVVIALAIIAILILHHREWVESFVAAYATAVVLIFTGFLLLIWFAIFSGLKRRTRFSGAAIVVALIFGAIVAVKVTTRVDGTVSGVGMPRLVWKWSPPLGNDPTSLPTVTPDLTHPVDLTKTTAQDFPQFLGPDRSNAISGIHLERDWTAKPPRKLWSQPIGLGWGAFAVVGQWAVTQEQARQPQNPSSATTSTPVSPVGNSPIPIPASPNGKGATARAPRPPYQGAGFTRWEQLDCSTASMEPPVKRSGRAT